MTFINITWKPATVSWFSFLLMGIIVASVGLSGTAHILGYLQRQLMDHSIEHNQEIANELMPKIETEFKVKGSDSFGTLYRIINGYQAFGFRILVIDVNNQMIVLDSKSKILNKLHIKDSWLKNSTKIDGDRTSPVSFMESGALRSIDEENHPMLLWLQDMPFTSDQFLLGIAKDEKAINDFITDLHRHLDGVLLATFILISLLGYFTLRSIGRIYERRLESQLHDRTLELEQAYEDILLKTRLATIGQTASVLTHEIRNPLASIKLALSGLKGNSYLKERELRRVELVLGEVDRLDGMLSETLDYVRPVKLSNKPVDLSLLVDKVIAQEAPLLMERDIKINFSGCSDCTVIRLDETQIYQVLLNLVKNALEASENGGVIDIILTRENTFLKLEVVNSTGVLSEEILKRAFEPFFSTKPKGTGLGLGLVKRVIEEHGGHVSMNYETSGTVHLLLTIPDNLS